MEKAISRRAALGTTGLSIFDELLCFFHESHTGHLWPCRYTGFVALIPGLFGEAAFNVAMPPAISHPEFYYDFYGVALVFQLVFVMIAVSPARYHALIPIAIFEKLAFFAPTMWLYNQGRVDVGGPFYGAMIDGIWMVLCGLAWWLGRRDEF